MAFKKSAPKTAQNTTTRKEPVRQAITLEAVIARAPHSGLAESLSRTFGLDCPESREHRGERRPQRQRPARRP